MGEGDKATCRRTCWLLAAAGGVLLWLALMFMAAYPAGQALILSVILAVAAGVILTWAVCSRADAMAAPAEAAPAPLPHPAPAVAEPAAVELAAAEPQVAATPRPDPTVVRVAEIAPEPPAKPAPKPRASSARSAAKAEPVRKRAAPKPAGEKAKPAVRASGLDAAMGRTKEAAVEDTVLLLGPRDGKGDDLKLIVGVGPKLAKLLNDIGVWHFDQIAGWKARDIALVDSKMANFKGRITRDGWVKQARALASGAKAEGKK